MAIKRYHLNPETGQPGLCVARRRCRFGADAVHYPSEQDARLGYERAMMREQYRERQLPKGEVARLPEGMVEGNQFHLPAGDYFVGDPYLTIATRDQAGWNDIVASVEDQFGWENDIANPAEEEQAAVGALYNGSPVLALKSWHGEGLHWSIGPTRRLPSETGLVGVVSEATLSKLGFDPAHSERAKLGMRLHLDEPAIVWRDEQGIIVVGGRLLICHNDLVQSKWFRSLDTSDGVNENVPTAETYNFIVERARLWAEDPALVNDGAA